MIIKKDDQILKTDIRTISVKSDFIIADNKEYYPPLIILSETMDAYPLVDLMKGFEHMDCWKNNDGEKCDVCPINTGETCFVMRIKKDCEDLHIKGYRE